MSEIDESISRMLEAYTSAVHAKDVELLMELYDPQVRVFDTWGIWSYDGAESWRTAVESWFESLGAESVKVSFEDVLAAGNSNFAVVSAVVTYTCVSAQGEQLRSMQNRLTWALRTSGQAPSIVHEHTSAPVGSDDMKAILQRTNSA